MIFGSYVFIAKCNKEVSEAHLTAVSGIQNSKGKEDNNLMTSREGYDAYTLYLGIKLHFHSKDYDFIKYNGKVKSDINSFLKRKDKYHFGKLFKTHKQELQDFYIANLSLKDLWGGRPT